MAKMDTFTVMSPIKSEASGNAGYWLGLLLFFLFFLQWIKKRVTKLTDRIE